jgi:hypothetical protein
MSTTKPPTKIFSDGHKTHNATEARALQEHLKSEKERRKYFEENKLTMVRARNPLTGEATPRDGLGEPIINPNWIDGGPPLHRRKEKELTEKIGVQSERYNCLGNIKTGRPNTQTGRSTSQAVIVSSARINIHPSTIGTMDARETGREVPN